MLLKVSTARNRAFLLVQSADHLTGLTGATPTVTLSKDTGAFAAAGGTVTEIANGWYKIALTTTDTNTKGDLAFHVTAASADPTDFADQVVTDLPGDSIASVTGAVGSVTGGVTVTTNNDKTGYSLTQTFPANFSTLAIDANGIVTAQTGGHTGTAQGGAAGSITLSASASATDNLYQNDVIAIVGGTGAGQTRLCSGYVGATKVASVLPGFVTAPDATSIYAVQHEGRRHDTLGNQSVNVVDWLGSAAATPTASGVPVVDVTRWLGVSVLSLGSTGIPVVATTAGEQGTAQAGAAGSITLRLAASATDNLYQWGMVTIVSGTGAGQSRLITGYTGSTKVATVSPNWTTAPGVSSVYYIHPHGAVDVGYWAETAVSAATAGIPDVNVKNINNVVAATPGAAGGVLIAGTNAPVTITGAGDALTLSSTGTNGRGVAISGNGSGSGATVTGGATGPALKLVGGATSGDGLDITTTAGDGLSILPTAGHAIIATANGTSKHGAIVTGGTAGTSDGIKAVAGSGGVDLRANITGALSGAVGSVTAAVAVGSYSAGADTVIRRGTAQGGTSSTITLDAGASAVDATYKWCAIAIIGGTGAGQTNTITAYTGTTKVAGCYNFWTTTPDATSQFIITSLDALRNPSTGYPLADVRQFQGTNALIDANNLLKVDVEDWRGAAVAATDGTNVWGATTRTLTGSQGIKKNAAVTLMFVLTDATTHAPKTGATVTATKSIDGAAFAAATNAVAEVSNGWYSIALTAAETNGGVIALRMTATGADDANLSFVTGA